MSQTMALCESCSCLFVVSEDSYELCRDCLEEITASADREFCVGTRCPTCGTDERYCDCN